MNIFRTKGFSTVSLEEIAEAHRYVETGQKKGNVVIMMDN